MPRGSAARRRPRRPSGRQKKQTEDCTIQPHSVLISRVVHLPLDGWRAPFFCRVLVVTRTPGSENQVLL